ncbi:MAG: small conductance mechanosensitive channel [Fusobacteriaceae bacterium]|nr:MscS Mechanosensitive ion channel [Fusobacteriales bacterium]MDN5304139.1 small conductance mechanosensitive channel [Fusobacteriaceae bacterium]
MNKYLEYEYIFLFLISILITIFIEKLFKLSIKNRKEVLNNSQFKFLTYLLSALIYIIGFAIGFSFLPGFKSISDSLLASSGIFAVAVGLAAQQAFSNIVGGIFIVIFKPFIIGDTVKFIDKNIIGSVEDITLRHTIIKNFENKRIIIPNSIISTAILENANIIEKKVCKFFEINISFDSDVDRAMEIIREEAEKHKDILDNRTEEEKEKGEAKVVVRIIQIKDYSLLLRAWIWAVDNSTAFKLICDLNYIIKKRFDEENIKIPYPHLEIKNITKGEDK